MNIRIRILGIACYLVRDINPLNNQFCFPQFFSRFFLSLLNWEQFVEKIWENKSRGLVVQCQKLIVKPSISTHSKPRTRRHMRLLKCFVLIILCSKTKHLRSLVRGIVRGFEWEEIPGLRFGEQDIFIYVTMYLLMQVSSPNW